MQMVLADGAVRARTVRARAAGHGAAARPRTRTPAARGRGVAARGARRVAVLGNRTRLGSLGLLLRLESRVSRELVYSSGVEGDVRVTEV